MSMVIFPVILLAVLADVRGCVCNPAQPSTMEERACSLTRVATQQTDTAPVFFIKDASPTKPNRWLAIPHALHRSLNDMTAGERNAYWSAAIEKARALWKDQWGIAVNSEERRSQCQMHAHIGKVLDDADKSGGVLVERAEEIPLPEESQGVWIHPEGNKLRVHVGVMAPEINLMR